MSQLPAISIVIPTRNAEAHLRTLLESLRRQTVDDFEVIIVDYDSSDLTRLNAWESGARVLDGGSIANSRNVGARAAKAERLLFVDSDMELDVQTVAECLRGLEKFDALCLPETVVGDGYWSKARGLEKRAYSGSRSLEAARCFRASVFRDLGGYDEALGGSVEDMGLQVKLLATTYQIGWVATPVLHHEGEMGLFDYLSKRRKLPLEEIRKGYPKFWRMYSSPRVRLSVLLRYLSTSGTAPDFGLLPGLVVLRAAELMFRLVNRATRVTPP
jgi:glycosyltransferase involved in cell wall biosynthesis